MNYLAEGTEINFGNLNKAIFSSGGPFADIKAASLGLIVSELLKYLFPVAGLLLFAYLVMGGFSYLTSGGDPKAMEQAKGKVTNAIVGFVIIFVAYWLVQILEFMFGLKSGMFGP